jgi:hypothetical protein
MRLASTGFAVCRLSPVTPCPPPPPAHTPRAVTRDVPTPLWCEEVSVVEPPSVPCVPSTFLTPNLWGVGCPPVFPVVAVFVHQTSIESNGFRFLKEGERVKFDVVDSERGKQAVKVVSPTGEPLNRSREQ